MNLERYTEGGETARTAVSSSCVFTSYEFPRPFTRRVPNVVPATFLRPSTREIYRPASRRFHPPLSRTRKLYQNRRARIKRVSPWNIPTFVKSCRALGKARAVFAEFRRFCGRACCASGCVYPVRSSNSICKSPRSSRGQFQPRHFPWRTKSHLRPSAIA